jgi:tetratricopeptide (TPR) repeat protein
MPGGLHRVLWGFVLIALMFMPRADAVPSDAETLPPVPGESDYAAGLAAFERQDWRGVIDQMTKVIARRPWRDNAYNLMGYAYRKLGDYNRAIQHYQRALDLNPHHRGALEYLGEAYLEMGCMTQAQTALDRLEAVCKRTTDGQVQGAMCEEWQDLKTAIEAPRQTSAACAIDQP